MIKKFYNYDKETYRGTIKQIMKVRGLRTISLANYNTWLGINNPINVHSIKLDVQDGYINIFKYNNDRCGEQIDDASTELYRAIYNQVMDIINNEKNIPTKVKRNILVKVFR